MGDRRAEAGLFEPVDRLVDGALGAAGDPDHLGTVEERHGRQGAEDLGLGSCGSHSSASSFVSCGSALDSFSSSAARSLNSCTFFWSGVSVKEMSWAERV